MFDFQIDTMVLNSARPHTGSAMEDRGTWRSAIEVGSVGIEMAVAITVGWLIGDFLDERLGTSPYMTALFLLAGIGAAFKALLRAARKHWPRT